LVRNKRRLEWSKKHGGERMAIRDFFARKLVRGIDGQGNEEYAMVDKDSLSGDSADEAASFSKSDAGVPVKAAAIVSEMDEADEATGEAESRGASSDMSDVANLLPA
jgi:hypothetical protein